MRKTHLKRLDNLLISNNLKRFPIVRDGNCYINAVLCQLKIHDADPQHLRNLICDHISEYKHEYLGFLKDDVSESSEKFDKEVTMLRNDGHWSMQLADCMPLATANVLQQPIKVFKSTFVAPINEIEPSLVTSLNPVTSDPICLAYTCIRGHEHYDGCTHIRKQHQAQSHKLTSISHSAEQTQPCSKSNQIKQCNKKITITPEKQTNNTLHLSPKITPRKMADYNTPVKKTLTRKRKAHKDDWLKIKRKRQRIEGEAYVSSRGKLVQARTLKDVDCAKCKFKCSTNISQEQHQNIFETYYRLGSYERQRDYKCQKVSEQPAKIFSTGRRRNARKYHLDGKEKLERVCKTIFLATLAIGEKTVEFALKQKVGGAYIGKDKRGHHEPTNKTSEQRANIVRKHIESFPAMESHYQRKGTKRQYLSSDLSINKMFALYQAEHPKEYQVSHAVYRHIFNTEYNLSFHKPKKDTCLKCTMKQKKERDLQTKWKRNIRNIKMTRECQD